MSRRPRRGVWASSVLLRRGRTSFPSGRCAKRTVAQSSRVPRPLTGAPPPPRSPAAKPFAARRIPPPAGSDSGRVPELGQPRRRCVAARSLVLASVLRPPAAMSAMAIVIVRESPGGRQCERLVVGHHARSAVRRAAPIAHSRARSPGAAAFPRAGAHCRARPRLRLGLSPQARRRPQRRHLHAGPCHPRQREEGVAAPRGRGGGLGPGAVVLTLRRPQGQRSAHPASHSGSQSGQ